ncbi:TIGR04086 family membrane protein [Kallotenue papyrolyticum]|uniref:TIGR04086 family membrane protein n=1 Tax=Kallotenue papyrolyticum TaxID=1325125 RepID=UPI00047859F7|nr:TIGR04086 family membrane protein [Kallotenue papyrolyticum]
MRRRQGIQWHAVLAGSVVDMLLSLVISAVGAALDPAIMSGMFFRSPGGALVGVLLVLAVVIGGWIAGRLAEHERFLHGFMVGGIGIILMLITSLAEGSPPLDAILLQFVATLLAGCAGQLSQWPVARLRK